MHTVSHAGVLGVSLERSTSKADSVQIPRSATKPQLFAAARARRSRDGLALALGMLIFAALLTIGVWMTVEVANGLALAEACDGKCVAVGK